MHFFRLIFLSCLSLYLYIFLYICLSVWLVLSPSIFLPIFAFYLYFFILVQIIITTHLQMCVYLRFCLFIVFLSICLVFSLLFSTRRQTEILMLRKMKIKSRMNFDESCDRLHRFISLEILSSWRALVYRKWYISTSMKIPSVWKALVYWKWYICASKNGQWSLHLSISKI